jgi:hypothetical protein
LLLLFWFPLLKIWIQSLLLEYSVFLRHHTRASKALPINAKVACRPFHIRGGFRPGFS